MDNRLIQERIREAQTALDRHDAERRYLVAILESYQGLARLNDPGSPSLPSPPSRERVTLESLTAGEHVDSVPKLNDAVLQVLKSRPNTLTTHIELWEGAEALGAKSDSENPPYSADSTARNLSKKYPQIRRVRPRVWVWLEEAGESEGEEREPTEALRDTETEQLPPALGAPDIFDPVPSEASEQTQEETHGSGSYRRLSRAWSVSAPLGEGTSPAAEDDADFRF